MKCQNGTPRRVSDLLEVRRDPVSVLTRGDASDTRQRTPTMRFESPKALPGGWRMFSCGLKRREGRLPCKVEPGRRPWSGSRL